MAPSALLWPARPSRFTDDRVNQQRLPATTDNFFQRNRGIAEADRLALSSAASAIKSRQPRLRTRGYLSTLSCLGYVGFSLLVDDRFSKFAQGGIGIFLFFQRLVQKVRRVFVA